MIHEKEPFGALFTKKPITLVGTSAVLNELAATSEENAAVGQ